MSTLSNDFSWSYSRHETFQSCLKRYHFAYYAAWGGWDSQAPPATREAYVLKRLTTRQQWAGHHAHQAIEFLLQHARRDPARHPEDQAEARQLDLMRNEFRDSRAGAYRQNPTRTTALYEHEYAVDLPPEEWKATVDRVSLALHHFLASDIWAALRGLPDDAFLSIERRSHFLLDGLKVYAIPDLAVRQDGLIRLYDWKTGAPHPDKHRLQLGVYALLAIDRWNAAPDQIEGVVYNPVLDQREVFHFTAEDLETLRDFIRDSADEMLFPLTDPERNLAGDSSAFDCTDQDEPCAACPFRRICPRWTA